MTNSINLIFGFNYKNYTNNETWEDAPFTWTDKDMTGVYAPLRLNLPPVSNANTGG